MNVCNDRRRRFPRIHRILHRVWLGPQERSEVLDACAESIEDIYRGWSFAFHNDASILDAPCFDSIRSKLKAFYHLLGTLNARKNPIELQSDLIRLCVLYEHGGLYLDSDMYAIRGVEDLLDRPAIFGGFTPNYGQEFTGWTSEAVIGAQPKSPIIWDCITHYMTRKPDCGHISTDITSVVNFCGHRDLILPPEYFLPHWREYPLAESYRITPNTRTIHLFKERRYDLGKLREIRKGIQ